ncbi:MAG: hypothetical protein COB58_10645 [Thalassobium sp.]|nr:MAG: hypothetical protein COB58_14570 [Thalassobium sp.]PHQ84525.1 MAG: hypothetical protein COB58_10645 [Thalassobium sp.]
MFKYFLVISAFFIHQAHAAQCNSLNDLDGAGCSVVSITPYAGDVGEVLVYSLANTGNAPRYSKIVYVVEPFSIFDDNTQEGVIDDLGSSSSGSLVDQLRADGFDLVFFGYRGNMVDSYLQRKAYALADALQQINQWRELESVDDGFYSETMIGMSLGGVIARYALASMEQQGIEHGISTYISVDSPHEGANVPLSLQRTMLFFEQGLDAADDANGAWYNKFVAFTLEGVLNLGLHELLNTSLIGGIIHNQFDWNMLDDPANGLRSLSRSHREALTILNKVDTIAAKQLLINHYESSSISPYRSSLLSELDSLGFPAKTKNIAIVNASLSQAGDRVYHKNGMYLNIDSNTYNSSRWDIAAASTNNGNAINFSGTFRYPVNYTAYTDIHYYRKNWNSSGYFDVDAGVCSSAFLSSILVQSLNEGGFSDKYGNVNVLDEETCFIPVASSMAIDVLDYNSMPDVSYSPFDQIWGRNVIDEHLAMGPYVDDIVSEAHQIPGWFVPVITNILF